MTQLEDFITSNNLEVPPPEDGRHGVLELLMKEYAISDASPPSSTQTTRVQNPVEIPQVDAILSPNPPDAAFPSGSSGDALPETSQTAELDQNDMAPPLVWPLSGPIELPAKDPVSLQFDPGNLDVSLPCYDGLDADWVWNLSAIPQVHLDIDSEIPPSVFTMTDFMPPHSDPMSASQEISPPTLLSSEESTDDEDQSAVTSELSARLGALVFTSDNESHYYGATSNLSLVRIRIAPSQNSDAHERKLEAQKVLDAHGLGQSVDEALVTTLVELYFSWHEPSLHTVDRETFEAARRRYFDDNDESTLFSLTLLNAMSVAP